MATRCAACNGLIKNYKLKQDGTEEDLCNECLDLALDAVNELEDNDDQDYYYGDDYEGGYN